MDPITKDVKHKHASSNTINHVLYAHFTAKRSLNDCATLFGKSLRTIQRWVSKFKRDGTVGRKKRDNPPLKFTAKHRTWLIKLYRKKPVLYLDEAKAQFQAEFGMTIGRSTIFLIMKTEGYTRQALERRAFEIKLPLIFRFAEELRSFLWTVLNLVFLDESSFDNRSMWRHFGYGKKGGRLVYRGEFRRKQRISVLAFLAHDGIQEVFTTEGTFTRLKFLDCCRKFALSGQVETHPGRNSVWVMDGARIHCSSAIVDYLRSLGLRVIFLPPNCPFFNPIELSFSYIKAKLQRYYVEGCSEAEMVRMVGETFHEFTNRDFTRVFEKCGYLPGGKFDPGRGYPNAEQ